MSGRSWQYPNLWEGCVGAWCPSQQRFPSTNLTDFGPQHYHGTLTNMDAASDWVAVGGMPKMALDFDATNDYVSLPNTGLVANASMPSICGWVRLRSTGANQAMWASGKLTGLSATFLRISGTNKVQFFEESGGYAVSGATSLSANTWYHIAATRTNNGVIVFLNGKIDATDTSRTAATMTQNTNDMIGGIWNAGSPNANLFDGQIDDVRIYSRTLASAEVALLASARGVAFTTAPRRHAKTSAAAAASTSGNLLLLGVG